MELLGALVDAIQALPAYSGTEGFSGETPDTIEAMADGAAAFIRGLDLGVVDLLGFSIGGCVAQAVALHHGEVARRLVLVGTIPRGGELQDRHPEVSSIAGHPEPTMADFLFLFFEPCEASQEAGRAFWERRHQRTIDVDPPSSMQTATAQRAALTEWAQPAGERFADLSTISQPTLVVNGNHDIMLPTINSFILSQRLPKAGLVIYPDSGHGSLFQYPRLFVDHVSRFLDGESAFS